MTNFAITSPSQFINQIQFDKSIPGEAFTHRMGKFPMERPAQFPDPEAALAKVFESLNQPESLSRLIRLIDAKMPIETIAATLGRGLISAGVTTPQAVVVILPAITVMLARIAEAAGIEPSGDFVNQNLQVEPEDLALKELKDNKTLEVNKASKAVDQSSDELSALPSSDKGLGLLQKPEGLL